MKVERQTVNLEEYPELVVIYLGMRVRKPKGILKLLGLGPQIQKSWKAEPDGLLLHEDVIWSLFPPHLGMRQYWRDLDSLERWTRSEPHRRWWREFLRDSGGTGFWHETYFMRGGLEAIYDDLTSGSGLRRSRRPGRREDRCSPPAAAPVVIRTRPSSRLYPRPTCTPPGPQSGPQRPEPGLICSMRATIGRPSSSYRMSTSSLRL